MSKILVFPCGTEIGLEVHRCLNNIRNIALVGGGVKDHGSFVYGTHYELPTIFDKNLESEINKVVESERIDFLYPAHDDVIASLDRDKIGCEVIGSKIETCKFLRSKKNTYKRFKDLLVTPQIDPGVFPVFLKPDVGQGSKGTHLIHFQKELDFYRKPDSLVLEYLPGCEYTVDCFTDFEGNLKYCSGRKRARILNGISSNTCPVSDPEFLRIANVINNELDLNGAWFFQAKVNKHNEMSLLEIAPRVGGSSGLSRVRGINLPLLSIYNQMKIPVNIVQNDFDVELDRSLSNKYKTNLEFDHVYVDLDDCFIINGKLNSELVRVTVEWINQGKKIHLLTKHAGNLEGTLKKFRIADLFDTKTQIAKSDKKMNYIVNSKCIFIDDSFSEREDVRKSGIPVFGVESLELF